MNYFYLFVVTFLLALSLTFLIRKFANKIGVVDEPTEDRKIHKKRIPLLGGLAIFLTFFVVLFFVKEELLLGELSEWHWLGVFAGALVLMIGGYLDDKYEMKARHAIIFPIIASVLVVVGGVGIEKITNPMGGYIYFDTIKIPILNIHGIWHCFVLFSDLLIFTWLLGMMYTTKLLDGIDGLVTGVVAIGAFIIFLFTISEQYYQGDIAIASIILCAACVGFLVFNWHPASIFLGEGGSLFLGFILGVLAIISGGKIAIALLVMGIPIMDVVWVIFRRIKEGKNPFKFADKKHLHHRLLALGIGQRKTVLVYYLFASGFGLCALFLQSVGKIFALGALIVSMMTIVIFFNYFDSKNAS
jgi:UDP-GlcNAc:undecaprenyl-phosphate/decaprenyl-phosphate GlcNAc-1-phosphate transferase